ncbi:MAG: hypothetical protein KDD37_06615, partial [Bdellovibrionales bacterium]|nr:hypothetical protein [Bdellovibrionales bacterium]
DNANTRGTNYAKEMIAADSGFAEMCPSNIRSKLKRRFDKSYNHQIAISCGPVELTKRAINDVREERKLQDSVEVISSCPQDLQTNAVLVYQTAFAREEDRLHAANESRKQDAFREEQLDLIRKQNEILEEKKKKEQQTDGYFKPMEAIPSY